MKSIPCKTECMLPAMVVALFVMPFPISAASYFENIAKSTTGVSAPTTVVVEKSTSTTGDYRLSTLAYAKDKFGQDGSVLLGQSTPFTAKSTLGTKQPTIGSGSNTSGPDWARADAVVTYAQSHATADAWKNTAWIDEYQYDLNATASVQIYGIEASSRAFAHDPFALAWNALDASDAMIMGWSIRQGSSLDIQTDGYGHMDFKSELDFGNDGSFDQLFWKLSVDSIGILDLVLGPGVSIAGGRSDSDIERLLAPVGYSGGSWAAPSDISISFLYDLRGANYTNIGISYQSDVSVGVVPEPASVIQILFAVTAAAAFGRTRQVRQPSGRQSRRVR